MIFGIDVVSILLGGFAAGMVLFIVSVGLSVTMGLMGFVNLAHGTFAMLGGYVTVGLMKQWSFALPVSISTGWFTLDLGTISFVKAFEVPFVPSLLVAFVVVAAISVVLERLLYRRLYDAPELYQVLFTIGVVFFMIATVTLLVGPENQQIRLPDMLSGQIDLGFVRYRTYSVVLIVVGVLIMLGLWLGFERTRMGAQIRSAVDNRRMAESLGINVDRLFTLTFAFGSGMAALGGGLGAEFLGLDPQYALKYLVFFLIVVAVGGLGRVTGVFYAALIIGVLDFVLKQYIPRGGTLYIYALTILLLLLRPQGLFGKKVFVASDDKDPPGVILVVVGIVGIVAAIGLWFSAPVSSEETFLKTVLIHAGKLEWSFYLLLLLLAASTVMAVRGAARYAGHLRSRRAVPRTRVPAAPAADAPARYLAAPAALAFAQRHHPRVWEITPWVAAIAAYFLFENYLAFGTELLVMVLFVLSLELALGYAGIVTLGHAAFFGAGAYAAGLISLYAGWNEPISLLFAAAAVAGVLGLLSGWVLLRTHGLTLLMLTLSFAAMLEELCNQFIEYTGGFDGKNLEFAPILGRFEFNPLYSHNQYLYALAVLFVIFLLLRCIVFSPFGQSLTGIRENMLRMPAVGTPVQSRLVMSYSISAALAGVAGALSAQTTLFVNQTFFNLERSATVIIILILGGYGRLYGAFLGAVAYMVLAHFLSKAYPTAWQLGLGLLLIVIALAARSGILGIGEALWRRTGWRVKLAVDALGGRRKMGGRTAS